MGQADGLGRLGALQRGLHQGLAGHFLRALRRGQRRVLVHQLREQLLVQAAPVDADAHRLAVVDGLLDDGGELVVPLAPEADVAGVDAVLGQQARAFRVLAEQRMAVVVKIAHQGHVAAHHAHALDDLGHGGGGLFRVDRDAHDLGPGAGEFRHLAGRGLRVLRVRVGHGLDHDRVLGPHVDVGHLHGGGFAARKGFGHEAALDLDSASSSSTTSVSTACNAAAVGSGSEAEAEESADSWPGAETPFTPL